MLLIRIRIKKILPDPDPHGQMRIRIWEVIKPWPIVLLFMKRSSSRSCKASERPYYHPSCGLTSGCSIVDNDKLAQGEYNRMRTTDIFLSISWWQADNWRLTGSISAPWSRHSLHWLAGMVPVRLGAVVCGCTCVAVVCEACWARNKRFAKNK